MGPALTKSLGDLRVVHLWVVLRNLAALQSRPDHEGVHRPLDVVLAVLTAAAGLVGAHADRQSCRSLLVHHGRAGGQTERADRVVPVLL